MRTHLTSAFFLLLGSCSDRPRHERFPGPPGRTTEFQQAQTTQDVLGGFDPTRSQIQTDKAIRGIVQIKTGFKVPSKKYVVFVSARSLDGGPPLAVTRLNPKSFPFRFSLTEANVMIEGTKFEGFVEVTVRIVQAKADGSVDPLSRQSGDLWGAKTVKVGSKNLDLLVDQQVP